MAITLSGPTGWAHEIEHTLDFTQWQRLARLTNDTPSVVIRDAALDTQRRFYRAVSR
jgi:hypothetical protein